jgi:hypothetical protein
VLLDLSSYGSEGKNISADGFNTQEYKKISHGFATHKELILQQGNCGSHSNTK